MKVRDRELKRLVEVLDKACLIRKCYWPRLDPGSFAQGRGYRGGGKEWLCGTRHAFGCPPEVWMKPQQAADSHLAQLPADATGTNFRTGSLGAASPVPL